MSGLVAAGKSRMAAVGACLRKLWMIAYGVLKNRVPFDPSGEENALLTTHHLVRPGYPS